MLRKKVFGMTSRREGQKFISIHDFPENRLPVGMNRRELHALDLGVNGDDEAALLGQYFVDHPRSPSAVRRPKVFRQGETFIVLLGRDVQHGIVGLGNTIENALRVFDLQYCNALRPPGSRSATVKARVREGK
jgi:hypothetical protein